MHPPLVVVHLQFGLFHIRRLESSDNVNIVLTQIGHHTDITESAASNSTPPLPVQVRLPAGGV